MTTFRSEVAQSGQSVEVDYTNPLSQYLSWAIIPSEGSGDSIKESVSGELASSPAGTLIWNNDGSVTGPDNTWIYRTKNYPQTFKEDALIFLDVSKHAPSSYLDSLFSRGDGSPNTKNEINIQVEKFVGQSFGFTLQMEFESKRYVHPSLDNTNTTPRTSLVLHWDASELKLKLYQNSQLVYESEVYTTNNERDMGVEMFCSLGGSTVKYYAGMYLQHPTGSFTSEEIESIVSDPYQVFKTREDRISEHVLNFGGAVRRYIEDPNFPFLDYFDVEFVADFSKEHTYSRTFKVMGVTFKPRESNKASVFFRRAFNNAQIDYTPPLSDVHKVKISLRPREDSPTNLKLSLYIDDLLIQETNVVGNVGSDYGWQNYFRIGNDGDGRANFWHRGWMKYFRVSGVDLSGNFHHFYYDFNQSSHQPYAPELINGQHGTLVGFPEPSGYVRELDSHEGVKFDGIDDYATTTITNLWQNDGSFCFEFDFYYTGKADQTLAGDPLSFNNNILIQNATSITVRMAGSSKLLTLNEPLTVGRQVIAFKRNVFEDFGAYDSKGNLISTPYGSTGGSFNMHGFGAQTNTSLFRQFNGTLYSAKFFTDFNATQLKHHWDFTKTSGLIVPDLVGGLDVTLVGFNKVYYRPEASGEIVGYQFNGTTYVNGLPTLPKNQSFDIKARLKVVSPTLSSLRIIGEYSYGISFWTNTDGSNFRVVLSQGNGHYAASVFMDAIDNPMREISDYRFKFDRDTNLFSVYINDLDTPITSITANINADAWGLGTVAYTESTEDHLEFYYLDWNGVAYYDFTTGDADQIIDTVGGNHATIVNAPTSGFLPLVDKQVYTVGEGKDYTNLLGTLSHIADLKSENSSIDFMVYGKPSEGSHSGGQKTVDLVTSEKNCVNYIGATNDAELNLQSFGILFGTPSQPAFYNYRDLKFSLRDIYYTTNLTFENCKVVDSSPRVTSAKMFKNCFITRWGSGSFRNRNSYILDSIIYCDSLSGSYNGDIVMWGASAKNTIIYKESPKKTYNAIFSKGLNSSNNLINLNENGGEQFRYTPDLYEAFADPTNGDFRIKQSYAEANLPDYENQPKQYSIEFNGVDNTIRIPHGTPENNISELDIGLSRQEDGDGRIYVRTIFNVDDGSSILWYVSYTKIGDTVTLNSLQAGLSNIALNSNVNANRFKIKIKSGANNILSMWVNEELVIDDETILDGRFDYDCIISSNTVLTGDSLVDFFSLVVYDHTDDTKILNEFKPTLVGSSIIDSAHL